MRSLLAVALALAAPVRFVVEPGAAPKSETVTEYVLYRGAFDDPTKQPLFSDSDRSLVELHRLEEVRNAFRDGRARPVLCVSSRVVTYPLSKAGERLALGSECVETEITS